MILKFYNALSSPTRLLIQSFLSVLGSVLAGVATTAFQYYTQAGHLDFQGLLNVSLLTFALLFGKTMHDWVPNHAQQMIQAYKDSESQLRDALQRQQNISSAVVAAQSNKVSTTGPSPAQVIVQTATTLTPEHVQAISAQIAVNLASMAASSATPLSTPVQAPVAIAPAQDAYIDPMRNSAVLPAYVPPVAVPDQVTQAVPTPQLQFAIPARPVTMP